MNHVQIANTILEQLGGRKFRMMVGAKYLTAVKEGGLLFRYMGGGYCKIILNSSDYYDVQFLKIRKLKIKVTREAKDIDCDRLAPFFREVTGLETRMPQVIGL